MVTPETQINYSKVQMTNIFEDIKNEAEKTCETLEWTIKLLDYWRTEIENHNLEERDLFGSGECHGVPHKTFQTLKNALMRDLKKIFSDFLRELPKLQPHITQWKRSQLYEQQCRRPKQYEDASYVELLCQRAFTILDILFQCVTDERIQKVNSVMVHVPGSFDIPQPTELVSLEEMLKHCMEKLVNMCLVVFLHPPSTMITEKEKVASRDRDTSDVNNSKKFNTSVGLLGGSVLEGVLEITEVNIKLMFREDIAASLRGVTTKTSSFQIHGDLMANRRSTDRRNSECEQKCCMKMYENVRVENFSRREQKNVYKQICHAIYDVVFVSPPTGWKFEEKVLSLPIIVRTGANQASEHKGAQLWYGFSAQNVYDVTSAVVSSLSLDRVVQMMDERIRFIGGRSLMDYEKKFLCEKLECVAKSGKTSRESRDKITLDAFIKEKVQLASHYPGGPGDTVTFSLWRWFHCIVNLLEGELKNPWKDGVIFGFASRKQCNEALVNKEPGSCLIRFSESCVEGNHENSKGRIGVVLKTAEGVHFAPPITAEKVQKHGLSVMIRNTKVNERIPEVLLPAMCAIDDLRKYDPPQESEENPAKNCRYLDFKEEVVVISTTKKPGEKAISSPQHTRMPDYPLDSTYSNVSRITLGAKRPKDCEIARGGKQKCKPPESLESTPPISFPSSPASQFCTPGVIQNMPSAHIEPASHFSFPVIPATVMESEGFDPQLLIGQNNEEAMDTRGEQIMGNEDIDNILTPDLISNLFEITLADTALAGVQSTAQQYLFKEKKNPL